MDTPKTVSRKISIPTRAGSRRTCTAAAAVATLPLTQKCKKNDLGHFPAESQNKYKYIIYINI